MSSHPLSCKRCSVECVFERAAPWPAMGEAGYAVSWVCPKCNQRSVDLCPLGPLVPNENSCLNCGGQFDPAPNANAICAGCGLPRGGVAASLGIEPVPADPCGLAMGQLKTGLLRRAIGQLNQALAKDRSLELAWSMKLQFLQQLGYLKAERTLLQNAIEVSGPTSLYFSLGYNYQQTGSDAEAVEAYKGYLAKVPDGNVAAVASSNQANSLARLGRSDEAERLYKQAIDLQPGAITHLLNFIRFLLDRKRFAEALPLTETAMQLEAQKEYAIRVHEDRAFIFAELNDGERSLSSANQAISMGGNSIRSHYLYGRALGMVGRLQDAQDQMKIVLARDSSNRDALRANKMIEDALGQSGGKKWWEFWK